MNEILLTIGLMLALLLAAVIFMIIMLVVFIAALDWYVDHYQPIDEQAQDKKLIIPNMRRR